MAYVFISYSKKNYDYARKLADYLIEKGFDVWIDDRIDFGSDWIRAIYKAIDDCSAFILVMTPESEQSNWVEREYIHADRKKKQLFPLLLEGEVFPFFERIQDYDLRGDKLPDDVFLGQLAKFVQPKQANGQEVATLPQQLAEQIAEQTPSSDATKADLTEISLSSKFMEHVIGALPPEDNPHSGARNYTPPFIDETYEAPLAQSIPEVSSVHEKKHEDRNGGRRKYLLPALALLLVLIITDFIFVVVIQPKNVDVGSATQAAAALTVQALVNQGLTLTSQPTTTPILVVTPILNATLTADKLTAAAQTVQALRPCPTLFPTPDFTLSAAGLTAVALAKGTPTLTACLTSTPTPNATLTTAALTVQAIGNGAVATMTRNAGS